MKPILCNTEMVRAILEGRKTQTRRVIKPQPAGRLAFCSMSYKAGTWSYPGDTTYQYWGDEWRVPEGLSKDERMRHWTPPCNTGDILWVREAWTAYSRTYGEVPHIIYRADGNPPKKVKWHPSIHMPRKAARIFLRVTDVRVERLQDITTVGLQHEGILPPGYLSQFAIMTSDCFERWRDLWDSTIKKADLDRYGWEANPWVWVISFERCEEPEEDAQC